MTNGHVKCPDPYDALRIGHESSVEGLEPRRINRLSDSHSGGWTVKSHLRTKVRRHTSKRKHYIDSDSMCLLMRTHTHTHT